MSQEKNGEDFKIFSTRLRDNSQVLDVRLDRLPFFDIRSRKFRIFDVLEASSIHRSYTWRIDERLDQGQEGACVGFGLAHELAARPAEVSDVTNAYAREVYLEAQKIDPWPGGMYPGASPRYEGTSVLAGIKTILAAGWAHEYRWAFGLNDLILGVGHNGPAVLGISWLRGMYTPDSNGFIHASGDKMGGHCILCTAVNVKEKYFTLVNSWGPNWGEGGACKISFDDMEKLLYDRGEAAFLMRRHTEPRHVHTIK